MELETGKLEDLFAEKYKKLGASPDNEIWVDYCDRHKIVMLHGDWLADTINSGGTKGKVCIHNCEEIFHENVCPWLLVPKRFAEKALVLGYLP